jgi:hypothetical protein
MKRRWSARETMWWRRSEQRTFELEGEVVGQVTALVITAKKEESVGVVDLETPEVEDTLREEQGLAIPFGAGLRSETAHFDGEVSAVDVISEEEVASVGGVPSNLEQLHQVELRDQAREAEWHSVSVRFLKRARRVSSKQSRTHVLSMDVTADCSERSRSQISRQKRG